MQREKDWIEQLPSVNDDSLGSIVIDADLSIHGISDAILRRTGVSRLTALEKDISDFVHPVDTELLTAAIERVGSGQIEVLPGVVRVTTGAQTWDIYEVTVAPLGEAYDDVIMLEFSVADESLRAQALIDDMVGLTQLLVEPESLPSSLQQIADFAERNVDRLSLAITIFSEDGTATTFCQRELDEVTTEMNAAAHPLSLPQHVTEAYSKAKIGQWRNENEVGTIIPDRLDRMTMVLVDFDGNILGYVDAFRTSKAPPTEPEWRVYRLVLQMLRAIMLNAQLDARLDFLGVNDPLTGLNNRHSLLDIMSREEISGSGVLVINLDGFSWVNSSMGFSAGDTVLASVAASLLAFVPSKAVTARLSGDEFLVWLPTVDSETEVFRTAEQMRTAIMVPLDNDDRRGRTRCSIGATRGLAGENAEEVIHRATAAMGEAKAAGGDRVQHS